MNRIINKYLNNYAEAECQQLQQFSSTGFQHCLVIPCFDESTHFIKSLEKTFQSNAKALVILVVNQPDTLSLTNDQNIQVLDHFNCHFKLSWENQQLKLYRQETSSLYWLVVDRSSPSNTIPYKQGVGLARKIGCDLAATLHSMNAFSGNWIHCTDADTILPQDYFQLPPPNKNTNYSLAIYNFRHKSMSKNPCDITLQATLLYESAIKYYVQGLTWAGSPYNIHTIGSTIALNVKSYCQVRGFPKRPAGEDFYLINKLLKTGTAYRVPNTTLFIDARPSHRVPFGTGPAVTKIASLDKPADEYTYYSPKVFIALKLWLDSIPGIWDKLKRSEDPLINLPNNIRIALEEAQIHRLWTHIKKQVKHKEKCIQAIHDWFDAFQTLKFIRRMQEEHYPAEPLKKCLLNAPFST